MFPTKAPVFLLELIFRAWANLFSRNIFLRMNHFIIYLLLGLKSAQGVVVYRRGVCEVGVEMWMEPEHVPVNVLEALSYGTGAGLRRDVGMDQGPCASFLLFYHVRPRMEI